MTRNDPEGVRARLIRAGTDRVRRDGYAATSVDAICRSAKVTKGAFFHHFGTKEDLLRVCLEEWCCGAKAMEEGAPFRSAADPVARVLGYMEFFTGVLSTPGMLKSCLAGTTVQEAGEANPVLREAADACFSAGRERLKALLDDACRDRGVQFDTGSVASLWMAAVQGAMILHKASREDAVIPGILDHVHRYVAGLYGVPPGKGGTAPAGGATARSRRAPKSGKRAPARPARRRA